MSKFIPSSFFGVYRAISITSLPNLRRSITPTAPYHHRHIRLPLFHQFVRCHKVGRSKTKNSPSEGTCKHAPLPPSQQNGAVINKVLPGRDSVVKVDCVHTRPNFSLPWQMERQSSSIGSGFVIEGRRVLTNAQSVDHHTLVKLMKRGSRIKYVARVLAIGTDCDLAMLTVEDDAFWEGLSPVELGGLPEIQDAVTVMGYPVGGDTLSVTSGVVSRMEIISYGRSTRLLGIQIDAAINAGNSGGPTFSDKGICVGMAFQSLKDEDDDVENIGYAIPTPVINHFIQDYDKNGAYTGFPDLEIELQVMDNPDLRSSMGMKPDQTGVRIRTINPASPVCEILKPNDVILSFDGVNIDNDGTVPYIHGESIDFSYLVAQKYTEDSAKIEILRESAIQNFEITLNSHRRLLLAGNSVEPPSYYIIAGFVFTTVSIPYLRSEYWAYDRNRLFNKLKHSKPDEEIVIVSQVLEADINNGYEEDDFEDNQVLAFNGEPVKNLKSLATMVESCSDEYMKFELEYQKVVVLRTDTAKAATLDILATHRIASAMSEDLMQTNLNKPIVA